MTKAVVVSEGTTSAQIGGTPERDVAVHVPSERYLVVGDDAAAVAHLYNLEVVELSDEEYDHLVNAHDHLAVTDKLIIEIEPEKPAEIEQEPQTVAEPEVEPETQPEPEVTAEPAEAGAAAE